MKEILEAFAARIKSPVFGYTVLAFFIINWKSLVYILASKEGIIERFTYFDTNTSIYSLLIFPVIFAVFGAITYPWINYAFLLICRKPTDLRNGLQAESEHTLLIKKQALEETRSSLLANKEQDLIERAKRDSQVEEIEDEEARDRIKKEIEKLRMERDELLSKSEISSNAKVSTSPQDIAKSYKQMAEIAQQRGDLSMAQDLLERALDIENRYLG